MADSKFKPRDFSGGIGSKCFRLLEDAGFQIVEKASRNHYVDFIEGKTAPRKSSEADFHAELESLYRRTGEATGGKYWPSYFLRSVRKLGGLAFAKQLLAPGVVSSGFEKISSVHRADLSVEAVALDPRYSHLFTPQELTTARERLRKLPPDAFPALIAIPGDRMAEELPEGAFFEGAVVTVVVNRYERDAKARAACLKHFGARCQVCEIDFGETYGEDIGKDFMHVHHKVQIHTYDGPKRVDPKKDLVPVCPNCHAMLHRQNPPFDVEQLQARFLKPSA